MDQSIAGKGPQATHQMRAAEGGTVSVLHALALSATEADEREILLELVAAAQSARETYDAPAFGTAGSAPARYRLMAQAAGLAFVPVLIALEADQARAAERLTDDVPPQLSAVIQVRAEVLRGLAATSRERHSGNFRAAVFGANDGLVSNLALVVGMSATGVSASIVLAAGVAGLLAGALSMAAGEYISVRSARELLQASRLDPASVRDLASQGTDNEHLEMIYRARGHSGDQARAQIDGMRLGDEQPVVAMASVTDESESTDVVGQAWGAAISSFFFFASGALIPILPFLFGMGATTSMLLAVVLVGLALLATGATVGLLSGASAVHRAFRQLAIGYGAAAATYALGLIFGAVGVG